MNATDYKVGIKFRHRNGDIVVVIEENGEKFFNIEDCGYFSYIDDDNILYETDEV
jgi:hypothetical protein